VRIVRAGGSRYRALEKEPFTPRGWSPAGADNSRGAFSLVELLVVVAVVSLLTAILLPVVGRPGGRPSGCGG
jgi:prepilin-type N-terminal cleavage/methylation domain-containing protein